MATHSSKGAMNTSLFTFQHSMVPRLASSKKKTDAASSPKSVISDMHLPSPGSSSSNNKCQPRGLDRSYSTSDSEYNELDYALDSIGTSQELDKSENSGPLESLPETHSLALEVTNASVLTKVEVSETLKTSLKRGNDKPLCRIPLFPAMKGLESTPEPSALFILGDRTTDLAIGRSQYGATQQSSAALRSAKYCEERATTARENNWVSSASASEVSAATEQDRETHSKWYQTTMSSESPSDQHEKVSSSSSARRYSSSESGLTRRRDPSGDPSWDPSSRDTFSAELSSSGMPLERTDDNKRSVKPSATTNCGYPIRFFPGYNTHAYSASSRVHKAARNYSRATSSPNVPRLHPHRFLSGPLFGGMILKPPPSKWDDAEKWIVSPGRKQSPNQPHHGPLPTLLIGRRHSIASGQIIHPHHGMDSPDFSTLSGEKTKSPQFEHSFVNLGNFEIPKRSNSQKKHSKTLSFGDLSRKGYYSRASSKSPIQKEDKEDKEDNGQKGKDSMLPSTELFIVNDKSIELNKRPVVTQEVDEEKQQAQHLAVEPEIADCIMKTSSEYSEGIQVSKQSRSVSMQELSTVLVAAHHVSLQAPKNCSDMGIQMTHVETPKHSTYIMPGCTESPTKRNTPLGIRTISMAIDSLELPTRHMEKLEHYNMVGDDQPCLDRSNTWTTREEEEIKSAASPREDPEDLEKFQLAAKTTSWEEAKRAKAAVRFRNKEAKIKVWEKHQKAQAEAKLKKTEAKVEKILAGAREKMKERQALASKKAAKMTAANEEVRNQQAAKIAVRVGLMRKGGFQDSPSKTSFKCCFWGLRRS